jgi:hypothetical protein
MTTTTFDYSYSTQTASPPGDRQVRTDASPADPAAATAVFTDYESTDGTDVSATLLALVVGDELELRGVADPTRYARFSVAAAPVDQTGYVEVPVAFLEAGSALSNGACKFTLDKAPVQPPVLPPSPDVCSGPSHPPTTVMVPGGRRIRIPQLTVEWGDRDLRDTWTGEYVFCSFACLAAWATEKALQHDGDTLVEGDPPHVEHYREGAAV